MINNDSVAQALGTLERFAPAEDEVLSGMRTGIARRRKRRQVASVVGVAGAAAVVALGVVYAAQSRDTGNTGFAGAAAPPTTSAKAATPAAQPALPFSVGWVPDGYQLETWEAGTTDGMAQYVGSKDFQAVVVWISAQPKDKRPSDTEEPTAIAGRQGVIRRLTEDAGETQFIWQLADGRWAMVGGRVPTVTLASLRHVAESVSVTPTRMPAPFSLTTLPDGYRATTWMGGSDPLGGSLMLCRSTGEPRRDAKQPDCVDVTIVKGAAPAVILEKDPSNPKAQVEIPIDQQQTVNGLLTRATANGRMVVAQVDAGHYAQASSPQASTDLLRQVVASVRI